MQRCLPLCLASLLVESSVLGQTPPARELNHAQIDEAAANAHSLFLDRTGRVSAIDTFVKLVRIKGPSGKENAVADELKRLLVPTGAATVPLHSADAAPHNLVMELPASTALASRPAILLNAHIDTIDRSTPELLAFDPATRDFFHPDEADRTKVSSFGGDDRSSVAAMVEAIRILHTKYWSRGVVHRRIILVFTAEEERGCVGAKYLTQHEPQLFEGLELSLSMDGPLDLKSKYPEDSFVAVSAESDRSKEPYQRVLALMGAFCERTRTHFGQTELGLGLGDFASFPPGAHAGLHLRSPVRGWHTRERVNLQDQLNHVDLLCYLVLGWDDQIPPDILEKKP
jgi:hypothetical protein